MLFLYGDSAGRRAPMLPREDLFAAPHHAKAAAQACRAAHLASSGWLPTGNFPTQGRARAPSDARRARASVQGAPSNMRLRSEEHTSELQSLAYLVCRLLL